MNNYEKVDSKNKLDQKRKNNLSECAQQNDKFTKNYFENNDLILKNINTKTPRNKIDV